MEHPGTSFMADNTAAPGGDGTAEAPFTNLADADTAATRPWDIVYVHETTVLLQISMMIHFPSIKTISFLSAAANHSPSLLARVANAPASNAFLYTIATEHK